MGRHYTVISCDCPAGATYPEGGFRDYVGPAHRDLLREEMVRESERQRALMARLFARDFMAKQDETEAAAKGGRSGAWDPVRRIEELEADGIVADVIFPDGSQD